MASALSSNSGGTNFKRLLMSPPFLIVGAIVAAAAVFLFVRHQQSGVAAAAQVGANNSRTGPMQSSETLATGTLGAIADQISQLSQNISTLAGRPNSPVPATASPPASQSSAGLSNSAQARTSNPITPAAQIAAQASDVPNLYVPPPPLQSASIFAAAPMAAPAPAAPVAGAYLTTSLGEGTYAAHVAPAPTTGPGIIASLRQAIAPVPKAPAAPQPASGFTLNAAASQYYVNKAAVAAQQSFRASERIGAGVPYQAPAPPPPAPAPAPLSGVDGNSKLHYF